MKEKTIDITGKEIKWWQYNPEMTEKQIHHVVTVLNKIANNIKNA